MFVLYSVSTQNKKLPSERAVHVFDTDLPERIYVKYSTQSPKAFDRLATEIDDFIGDQTKDLRKPFVILGVRGDEFGLSLIKKLCSMQPVFVDCLFGVLNQAVRGAK